MNLKHVIKHSGNFCEEVAKGLIGYGREIEKGRGRQGASNSIPASDGYATREADITLGGFLRIRVAQRATAQGTHLSTLSVQEKQNFAFHVLQDHLREQGTVNREHYHHWLVRLKTFAKNRRIALPHQNQGESHHAYFRRLRAWIRNQPGSWPELRPAAGTHLILSPDPQIWPALRAKGMDERQVLNNILGHTLREFADWRRKQFGPGHSLGWVAGTHVRSDGADRHPHIHLVVIKRDESGREVDWSVSCLKGHRGKTSQPDPMRELKRLFAKHVQKERERLLGKEADIQPDLQHQRIPASDLEHRLARGFRRMIQAFRAVSRLTQPRRRHPFAVGHSSGWGTLLRAIAITQVRVSNRPFRDPLLPAPHCSARETVACLLRVMSRSTSALEPSL
ncbi:MAG: hypothetical protein PHV34_14735 [Verrucomicrobiae bacterium]|nr:hypothetical protein [Verrucomicrobiae bacterium]